MDQSSLGITPKGRGALLKQLLLRNQSSSGYAPTAPGPPVVDVETAAPRARGRAAILEKLKLKNKALSVGTPTASSDRDDVSSIKSGLSEMTIQSSTTPVKYQSTHGVELRTTCNYIKLITNEEKGVHAYELRFEPIIDAKSMKFKLLSSIVDKIGTVRLFDGGHLLYLPFKTAQTETSYTTKHPVDQSNVRLILVYQKTKRYQECIHLFNVLFKRIMHALLLTPIGRNFFDQKKSILIPQHRLEILPGYVTVVDEYEGGLFLCLDTLHKVLRTQTVLEMLRELLSICQNDPRKYKDMVNDMLIGQSILTRYNNKLYRVDDILWDKNPKESFETVSGPVTFLEYFKKQYNLDIKDTNQPLLLNNVSQRVSGQVEKVDRQLCLIPELCVMTGLTDKLRENFVLMKDMSAYTRVTPAQRLDALRKYISNVNDCPKAKQILDDWGLTLNNATIDLKARVVDREVIIFGEGVQGEANPQADWTQLSSRNKVLFGVDLRCWVVMCPTNAQRQAHEFVEMYSRIGAPMGIRIAAPTLVVLPNDNTHTWSEQIQKTVKEFQDQLQIIVLICPTVRNERYSAIKKLCCSVVPVASQVINTRTLNNQSKIRGIVQKISLQINCKLGGSLWSVRFPFKNWMICGIDVFHCDGKQSVCAFVSSLNDSMSRWYTSTVFQKSEIGDHLKLMFVRALEAHREKNGLFPSSVVIYRDGVGDGQIKQCQDYEVAQYLQALKDMHLQDQIKLCVLLVQKRINTRILNMSTRTGGADNPPPGTVVDHTVTRRNYKDFFLVSQSVRQGTVSPTHYVIIHDTLDLPPDRMQRLTYKMCHLYYNWTGTVRVPAPCQYSHKVAFLTGKYINKVPDAKLSDRLFYL